MQFLNCKSQRKQQDTCTCSEKESIKKLSYFNFQGTKLLYQNNFKHIAFFFTFFSFIDVIIVTVITPNKISYGSPRKQIRGTQREYRFNEKAILDVKKHFNYKQKPSRTHILPLVTNCWICQRRSL